MGQSNSRIAGKETLCTHQNDEFAINQKEKIISTSPLSNNSSNDTTAEQASHCSRDDRVGATVEDDAAFDRKSYFPKLSHLPKFLAALERDESTMIASYTSAAQVDYLSCGVYKAMGFDRKAPLAELSFPVAPHRGAIFFRERADGSVVQFHNTFLTRLPSGEVFSIDEPLSGVEAAAGLVLRVTAASGVVQRCEVGSCWKSAEKDFVGKRLLQLVPACDSDRVTDAVTRASGGACCYSVSTEFGGSRVRASVDFFPCMNGQVVACVTPLISEAVSSIIEAFCPSTSGAAVVTVNRDNSFGGTDVSVGDMSSSARPAISLRQEQQVYHLTRRVFDLSAEIKYLHDFRDNALLPMYSVSPEGCIIWANAAMVDMMGYTDDRHAFIGTTTQCYYVDVDLLGTMFGMILNGKPLIDFPCNLKRRDGKILNVTCNSNAKFDSDGNFVYSRCIVQDMTERNKLLQERDDMKEKQVLAEVNEKEAIAASKTKSEFLAVMSHEIRTPINGVLGAASLLSITSLNDEQRDYVNTISDSADILLSLIHNVLDITKIESGKMELDKVPLRVVDIVRKCTDVMKYRAMEKEIEVKTVVDSQLDRASVWHHGDPTRLNQVLLNFLSNAVKFTHSGGVECKLVKVSREAYLEDCACSLDGSLEPKGAGVNASSFSTRSVDCDEEVTVDRLRVVGGGSRASADVKSKFDVIRIEVTDTGCGIADCSHLFAPFVQANKSVHQKYGGTGLGLNISKKIVEMMHGQVGIESTEGVGTTVWAEIPLRRAPVPRKGPEFTGSERMECAASDCSIEAAATKRNTRTSKNRYSAGAVRMLIAEDNKVNQKVLCRMLETLGYTDITVAENGQKAVEAVQASWDKFLSTPSAGLFDIVLMDCLMPVMDGWAATEEIRRLEEKKLAEAQALSSDCPALLEAQPSIVLALTANVTEEDQQRCSDCGMDGFYAKPLSRDALNALMLHWVSVLFACNSPVRSSNGNSPRDLGI